jgi:hypothetical protein
MARRCRCTGGADRAGTYALVWNPLGNDVFAALAGLGIVLHSMGVAVI